MISQFDFKWGVGCAGIKSRQGGHCDYSEHKTEKGLIKRDGDRC